MSQRSAAFTLTIDDGTTTITLNRPARMNAPTRADAMALIAAFDRTDPDDSVRSVTVIGTGRAVCAGAYQPAGGLA